MILFIESYEPTRDYFNCVDEKNTFHKVDLFANGEFHEHTEGLSDEKYKEYAESFVGKIIEVERLVPHEEIALGIAFVQPIKTLTP